MPFTDLAALEICSGAGGQAAGLETAGFELAAAVEIDPNACRTLRANRPLWRVIEADVREISGRDFRGIDLFAGGVPCPPFSIAGKQFGAVFLRSSTALATGLNSVCLTRLLSVFLSFARASSLSRCEIDMPVRFLGPRIRLSTLRSERPSQT